MESLGFSVYKIMSSLNSDSFILLSNLDAFISFSCLIALARTSNTMFRKSGKESYSVQGAGCDQLVGILLIGWW